LNERSSPVRASKCSLSFVRHCFSIVFSPHSI
jgi:hypothetical protein